MKPTQLSNLQLLLLSEFDQSVSDKELLEIRDLLAQYHAQKATAAADEFWDEKGWNEGKINELLHTHLRRKSS